MIPNQAHFIWIGSNFPWLYYLSVYSAVKNGGFDKIFVHHKYLGADEKWFYELGRLPGVVLQELDFDKVFSSDNRLLFHLGKQRDLIERNPLIQSDILRYAVLYLYGGVYLDLDIVVLRSLKELLLRTSKTAFLGREKILFPEYILHPTSIRDRLKKVRSLLLVKLRNICEKIPHGYALYNRLGAYVPTVNGAVFGSEKSGSFVTGVIEKLNHYGAMEMNIPLKPGPFSLQEAVANPDMADSVDILQPDYFYPSAPGLTKHLFRRYKRVDIDKFCDLSISYAIHWYSSSSTFRTSSIQDIDCEYFKDNNVLFGSMLQKYVDGILA
ncbi:hypothetical protein S1OALGB6SA_507 [Olavius algarvensis spirochete endosymbiont]|nr:hypothetical protein S1OALGB6SA_507 [Olavius algarvensis spirochete endosymbiont]